MNKLINFMRTLFVSFVFLTATNTFSNEHKSNLRFDRESLFYNVCMEMLGNETNRADSLCYRYSEDVSGDNFEEIIDSMQTAFNNIHRRNPKSVPFRIKLNPKKVKKQFRNIVKDNNRSKDYEATVLDESKNDSKDIIANEKPKIDRSTKSTGVSLDVSDESESESKKASSASDSNSSQDVSVADDAASTKDGEDSKEAISKELLYEESNKVLLKRLCMKIDESDLKNKQNKCNQAAQENKNLSVKDSLEYIDREYKKKIDEALMKDALLNVADMIVEKDNLIMPSDFKDYVMNGGPDSKDKAKAVVAKDVVVEDRDADVVDSNTVVITPKPASSTLDTQDVIDNGPVNKSRDLIISDYEEILKVELDKLCPNRETQCVKDVVADVYKLRDEALATLDNEDQQPAKDLVAANTDVDETSQSEVITTPVVNSNVDLSSSDVNCSDDIQTRIKELLALDSNNILGKQFQLTSLKMALQIMEKRGNQRLDNVEDYIQKKQKNLIDSDNQRLTTKLVDFYRENGKVKDSNFIENSFNSAKKSNYFKASKRIYNKTASVLIMADVLSNEDSRFSELDAASVWFADTVNNKFKMSSYNGNLTNLSSLTYRVLGNLKNEKPPINIDKLNLAITSLEKDLEGHYTLMRNDIAEKFEKCFKGEFAQCNGIEQFNINTARALMDLTSDINSSNEFNVEIESKLKGNIGGKYKFDFLPGQYK